MVLYVTRGETSNRDNDLVLLCVQLVLVLISRNPEGCPLRIISTLHFSNVRTDPATSI